MVWDGPLDPQADRATAPIPIVIYMQPIRKIVISRLTVPDKKQQIVDRGTHSLLGAPPWARLPAHESLLEKRIYRGGAASYWFDRVPDFPRSQEDRAATRHIPMAKVKTICSP